MYAELNSRGIDPETDDVMISVTGSAYTGDSRFRHWLTDRLKFMHFVAGADTVSYTLAGQADPLTR